MLKHTFRSYKKFWVVLITCSFLSIVWYVIGLQGSITVPFLSPFSRDHCRPHTQFRRDLASRLIKAVEDVRHGNLDVALSEIAVATAILDNRYYYHTVTSALPQPGFAPIPVEDPNYAQHVVANSTETTDIQAPLNVSSVNFDNGNISQDENGILFPPIDVDSLLKLNSSAHLGSLVTILIDACQDVPGVSRREKTGRVVAHIKKLWKDVKIVIGIEGAERKELDEIQNGRDVVSVQVYCDPWQRAPLAPLLKHVSSPYVLLLVSPLAVTADLNITRLLTVSASMRGVGVLGVSERGIDAGWDYSCLQLRHKYSHLSILNGYEFSQAACIFCDVSSSSFLAATSVLQTVQHDSSLPVAARQIDWALRLRLAGVLTMTCPDVMVHTTNKVIPYPEMKLGFTTEEEIVQKTELKSLYVKLAQKFELNSISFPNRTFLEYNCTEIQFDCNARTRVQKFLLPPCCIEIKSQILKSYNSFTKDNLIPYKINYGTVLAAVKFKNHIPWDFDDDVRYENAFYHLFKSKREWMEQLGLSPRFEVFFHGIHRHNYIYITSPDNFSFDSWGADLEGELSTLNTSEIPKNIPCLQYGFYPTPIQQYRSDPSHITRRISSLRKDLPDNPLPKPTCYLFSLVRIGDDWVPSPMNPALEAIKMYGGDIYKHETHWRFKAGGDSQPRCSVPDHPLCLNVFPADGTLFLL